MARLFRTNNNNAEVLLSELETAEGFFSRAKGLLGRENLLESQGLLIKPCNNIHTFFMKFSIDCIFIDRKMNVMKTVRSIEPYRVVGPFWKAHSVIEVASGFIDKKNIQEGDQLYVVS